MQDTFTQAGIVLKANPSKGSDLILKILTKEKGTIASLARGARASKKRFSGGVDIFDCGVFELSKLKKTRSLYLLHGIEQREFWLKLRENLLCFTLASMAIETSSIFARDEDREGSLLFAPLYLCLKNLNSVDTDSKRFVCLIFFLIQLLRISGYDVLANSEHNKTVEGRWFKEMFERRIAFVPESRELIADGLFTLLEQIQSIDGWELNSGEEVLIRLQQFKKLT